MPDPGLFLTPVYSYETDPTVEFVDAGGHFHLPLNTDNADELAAALKNKGVEFVRAAWHDLPTARQKLNPAQSAFLTELAERIGE